jgi:hypothetical protein
MRRLADLRQLGAFRQLGALRRPWGAGGAQAGRAPGAAAAAAAAAADPAPLPAKPPSIYPVRKGEGLADIMAKRSITRAEMEALNANINLDRLKGGDQGGGGWLGVRVRERAR